MRPNVAIVGFGLMGRLCALDLYKQAKVSVFDSGRAPGYANAGWQAAAMLSPMAESVQAESQLTSLGWLAMDYWRELFAQFTVSPWLQQAGTLVLAHGQDQSELTQFASRLTSEYQAITLSRSELMQLEPELSNRFQQGLFLAEEGQLDNRAFYQQSYQQLVSANVRFNWHVQLQDLKTAAELKHFDCVIDCRGLGAKCDLTELRGVRGEILRVQAPDVSLNRPVRVLHPRYPLYIAPKPNNQYVLGATQIETEDHSPISVRSSLELLSAAYALHPGFAEAKVLESEVGLRPTLTDNKPLIRQDEGHLAINGMYRHGYLVGPVFSRYVADLVLGRTSQLASRLAPYCQSQVALPIHHQRGSQAYGYANSH